MESLKRLLDGNDLCAVLLLTLLLSAVGTRLVGGHPRLYERGVACGFLGALCYGAYGWVVSPPAAEMDLVGLAVRCLLGGFLVASAAWVGLGIVAFAHAHTLAPLGRRLRDWRSAVEAGRRDRRLLLQDEENRRRAAEAYAAGAPDREARQREAEVRATREAADRQRRDNARSACEIFYSLHAPDIADRFPRVLFEDYLKRYLGDDRPPEFVEEHARRLREVIEQHLQKKRGGSADVAALYAAYQEQCRKLDQADLDEEVKGTARAALYAELQQKLERMKEGL
jgi:hypothetical protein